MLVFGIITLIGIIILCTAAAYQVLNNVSVEGRFWPSVVGTVFIVFSVFSVGVLPAGLSAIPLVMALAVGIALAIVIYTRTPQGDKAGDKKEETAAADAASTAEAAVVTGPEKKEEVTTPEGKKGKKGKKAQEPVLPAAAAEPQKV